MYSGICRTGKLWTPLDFGGTAGFFAGGGRGTSGVKTGGFEGTGNMDTIGGCCFGGAGFEFLGPMTAVTLISPPDKARA